MSQSPTSWTSEDCTEVDTLSVFETQDSFTDVTFVVEDRKLHFCKLFLRAASPVFDRMFTSDFKEKNSSIIPLFDKKLEDMDIFLQQLHPRYSWKPLNDDVLEVVLQLSDEYETKHVHEKCQDYICERLGIWKDSPFQKTDRKLPMKTNLFYLLLCVRYDLKKPQPHLLNVASQTTVWALEGNEHYKALSDQLKITILSKRCQLLEKDARAPTLYY